MANKRCLADDGYWKRKSCNNECPYYDTCIYSLNEKVASDKLAALKVQEMELKETNKHDIGELQIYQSYSLDRKVQLTCERIKAWYEWWNGEVYIGKSGGKDSEVLDHLVHTVCGLTDVPNVFVDTGLEFDSVIIYTDKDNYYKEDEKNLYYVACTRAQHELIIYNQKNM